MFAAVHTLKEGGERLKGEETDTRQIGIGLELVKNTKITQRIVKHLVAEESSLHVGH